MLLNKGSYGDSTVIITESAWNELWKDQTLEAPVIASPYPAGAFLNNPYQSDTVRYGIGTWQDIVNPVVLYHEQISAAGAFGSVIWIDRCRNVTGLIFTFSDLTSAILPDFQVMDIVRGRTGNGCVTTSVEELIAKSWISIYPNPVYDEVTVNLTGSETQVYIIDLLGHTLKSVNTNGLASITINIRDLPAGTYVIRTGKAASCCLNINRYFIISLVIYLLFSRANFSIPS